MDLLGYIFIGALLFVGVLVVVGSVIVFVLRHRKTLAHWSRPDLASALGLPRAGPNDYAGLRAGVPVRFGYELRRYEGTLRGAVYPLWAEVAIAPPIPLLLDIRPRTAAGGAPIGWPEFDARYVVVSPDIPTARQLLPPEVMQQFLALSAHGGVTLTSAQVRFWTDQSWTESARIAWLLDSLIALSRQLSARGAAMAAYAGAPHPR